MDKLGGPSSKAGSWNQGGSSLGPQGKELIYTFFFLFSSFFFQWILSDECNLGVAGARGSCRDVSTLTGGSGRPEALLPPSSLSGRPTMEPSRG